MTKIPQEGHEYQFPDGTVEVVSAIVEDRILTIKEYGDVARFRDGIEDAEHVGTNPLVEELSVDMFRNEGDDE